MNTYIVDYLRIKNHQWLNINTLMNKWLRVTSLSLLIIILLSASTYAINESPVIETIDNQISFENSHDITITVSDPENDPLTLSVMSSNETIVSPANVSFSGTGSTRIMSILPSTTQAGTTTLTVTVDDGNGNSAFTSFLFQSYCMLDIPENIIAMTGAGFSLPLTLNNPNNTPIYGLEASISYDPQVITATGISITGTILEQANYLFVSNLQNSGQLFLSFASNTELYTDTGGIVANIYFTVIGSEGQSSPITFGYVIQNEESIRTTQGEFAVQENLAPVMSEIANTTLDEDTSTSVHFTVSDSDSIDCNLSLTITTSDPTLIPISNISTTCSENQYTILAAPLNNQHGTVTIYITVADTEGLTDTTSFDITINSVNDSPQLDIAINDQSTSEDNMFSFTFDENTFSDIDISTGDTLSYTATLYTGEALPAWLTFNPSTRTFSGTPDNSDVGTITVTVLATDSYFESISDMFKLTVANVNDSPIISNPIADQTAIQDSLFSFIFSDNTFADLDQIFGDSLSYTARLSNDDDLPTWLSFNASTRQFSGTPDNSNVGILSIKVTATDDSLASIADQFNLTIVNLNDSPILENAILDQSATEDAVFSFIVQSNTFSDEDQIHGDTLSYSATLSNGNPLPAWLSFNTITREFSGTPTNSDVGILTINLYATDQSLASVSDQFNISIENSNDTPILANAIQDQSATEDQSFSFIIPSNAFTDDDLPYGDTLTYAATQSNNDPLPGWLYFYPSTREFSGIPENANVGTLSILVTVSDDSLESVTDTFTIQINNINDTPIVANEIIDQTATQDTLFSFTFDTNTFSDPDIGDSLSYSATLSNGNALPSWLTLDEQNRTFSGTPLNDDVGVLTITVIATDLSNQYISDSFIVTIVNVNDAPVLANSINDQTATEDSLFEITIDSNTFTDLDQIHGDLLSYSATLSNGAALPDWLSFNAITRTLSGTPENSDVGTISIQIIASDNSNETATDIFTIQINNTNDAPELVIPMVDQSATEGSLFTYSFDANSFSDPDIGDSLTYSAKLSNGDPLPAWLLFDDQNRTLTGTPSINDIGILYIDVFATDMANASIFDSFVLSVENINHSPTVANEIADQTASEDAFFEFTFSDNTFSDVDQIFGDSLSYSATLSNGSALPDWLTFNSQTRTLSGTPENNDVGTITIQIIASDQSNETATDTFTIQINNTNDAPIVANAILDQTATQDTLFTFVLDSNTFSDPDSGDSLSYSATLSNGNPLPSWLTLDDQNRTFSGTPLNNDVGVLTIIVIATDTSHESISDTFIMTVMNVNDAPELANGINDQTATEDSLFEITIDSDTFTDIDQMHGDSLSYSATLSNGSALPDWLTFNTQTRTLSGTPENNDVGTISIQIIASDQSNETATDTFTIQINNTNDAPALAIPIMDQSATEGSLFTYSFDSNTFLDPDMNDTLTYSAKLSNGDPLPAWLSFDDQNRTLTGTPSINDIGILYIDIFATDMSNASVSDSFMLSVVNINHSPAVANEIADQTATEDAFFEFTFSDNTFTDADQVFGDSLSYSASLLNGSALPDWLTFNAQTRTLSGTPENNDVGVITIQIIASDQSNETATDTFTIQINNTNDSPIVANALLDQTATQDTFFSFAFDNNTFSDPDIGDSLSYSATLSNGNALPSWLIWDEQNLTLSGTPLNADVGSLTLTVVATDTSNQSISDSFIITVMDVNDAPVLANAIDDLTATEDSLFEYTIDSNTFIDVDQIYGDSLSYSATLSNGLALPNWLTFNVQTRTFNGTPENNDVGVITIQVTVTDSSFETATDLFTIQVNNTNDTPVVANAILDQTATQDILFTFALDINTFSDPDVGDALSYSAILFNGNALPSWLNWDDQALSFSGTPTNSDVGVLTITVIASDMANQSIASSFILTVMDVNDAPVLATPIDDQIATEDSAFEFTIDSNTFIDVDQIYGDSLSYSVSLSNGASLPSWLIFDAQTRTFSGTPENNDVGTMTIQVIVSDSSFETASDTFILQVNNTNDAPVVANALTDQIATQGTQFTFVFDSNTFSDPDNGDSLSYSATLLNGNALPSWIVWNDQNRSLSGTPLNSDVGVLTITIIAIDSSLSSVSDAFVLTILNVNDPPELVQGIPDQTATENVSFNFTVSENTITDPDMIYGDVLSYSVTLSTGASLPEWLTFDEHTRTFTGFPTSQDLGTYALTLMATDQSNASISDTFVITVMTENNPPELATPIQDQTASEDLFFEFSFDNTTFTDPDGETLSYSATLANGFALPDWLSFNPNLREFYGTPTNADVGMISITVIAKDLRQSTASDTFIITIENTNDAPILVNPISDVLAIKDTPFQFVIPAQTFNDPDMNDPLTYSATLLNGDPLPSWLIFDSLDQSFTGTPTFSDIGMITITIIANDTSHTSVSDSFMINILNTNSAPILANKLENQTINEQDHFEWTIPNHTFTDVDTIYGDILSYTAMLSDGSGLPAWLSFNGQTQTFSGIPARSDIGTINITVMAKDTSLAAVSDTFALTVLYINHAPELANAIVNQTINEDQFYLWIIPQTTFIDEDNDILTYTASLIEGITLPSWLSFDPITREFSGTPGNADIGMITISVTVNDTSMISAATSFMITVVNTNDPPFVMNSMTDQKAIANQAVCITLSDQQFMDIDSGDSLTYSVTQLNGNSLPSWLIWDAQSKTMCGTPSSSDIGMISITVIATDRSFESVADQFILTVLQTNHAPELANAIADQTISEDTNYEFTVPESTFIDEDQNNGDSLTYEAKLSDGSDLPAWLTFEPLGQVFFGTPLQSDLGTLTITVIATDQLFASASDQFVLTIQNTNDSPILVNPIPDQSATEDTHFYFEMDANTFSDEDIVIGDILTYTAYLANETPLPDWLTFDPSTQTFSGMPLNSEVGLMTIIVKAEDANQSSITDTFMIQVNNTNDPPVLVNSIQDSMAQTNASYSFTVDINTFTDPDIGDSLTYTAMQENGQPLPSWLSFNPSSRQFAGTPSRSDAGRLTITFIASDLSLESATDTFVIIIEWINTAPVISNIDSQMIDEDTLLQNIVFTIQDAEDEIETLIIHTQSSNNNLVMPSHIVISGTGSSRSMSLTPNTNANGSTIITLSVSDTYLTSTTSFELTVNPVNDPPEVADAAICIVEDQIGIGQLTAYDPDSAELTFVILSDPLFGQFSLTNDQTGDFIYTPNRHSNTPETILFSVTDQELNSRTASLFIDITPVNDAPVMSGIDNQQTYVALAVEPFTFTLNDIDSSQLTLTLYSSNLQLIPYSQMIISVDQMQIQDQVIPIMNETLGQDQLIKMSILPATGQSGAASITVIVMDENGDFAHSSFMVYVNKYTIHAAADGYGKIVPSGLITIDPTTPYIQFQMKPNTGYAIGDVVVDEISQGKIPTYTFWNVNQNHTITATFREPVIYTLVSSAKTGGTITPSGSLTVVYGMDKTYTITPKVGYDIDSLTIDGTYVDATNQYTFKKIVTNHQIIANFKAVPAPISKFSSYPGSGSPPLSVAFKNESQNKTTAWQWNFGDGTISNIANPTHTYFEPGSYTVTLKTTGPGGTNTIVKSNCVTIYTMQADFVATPATGPIPLTVAFTSKIQGNITMVAWDFGDGYTSTDFNPVHEYHASGNYTVSMTIYGENKSLHMVKDNYVQVYGRNITGQVIAEDTQTGLSGYMVEVWEKSTGSLVGETYTDQEGEFTFSCNATLPNCDLIKLNNIPATDDLILAVFPPLNTSDYYMQYYKGQTHIDSATQLSTVQSNLSLLPIELKPTTSDGITGRIYDNHSGMAGIQVNIYSENLSFGMSELTDSMGYYTFTGVKFATDYRVSVWNNDNQTEVYFALPDQQIVGQDIPEFSVYQWKHATHVAPAYPYTDHIDIILDHQENQRAMISGRVTLSTQQGLKGVWVYAFSESLNSGNGALTDEAGHYTITGLTSVADTDPYTMGYIVSVHNYSSETSSNNTTSVRFTYQAYDGADQHENATRVITGRDDIHFVLQTSCSISGYVKNSFGQPVPYVDITVKSNSTGQQINGQTDLTGKYVITGLSPVSDYIVAVFPIYYPAQYYQNQINVQYANKIDLTQGDVANINFELDEGYIIQGNVYIETINQNNQTEYVLAKGIWVNIESDMMDISSEVVTDSNGLYQFSGLNPNADDYILSIRKSGFMPVYYGDNHDLDLMNDSVYSLANVTGVAPTQIQFSTNHNLILKKGFNITGKVMYKLQPVGDVRVEAWSEITGGWDDNISTSTFVNGSNYLLTGLPPGQYVISAYPKFFKDQTINADIVNKDAVIHLIMEPLDDAICGTVYGLDYSKQAYINAWSISTGMNKSIGLIGTGQPMPYTLSEIKPASDYKVELLSLDYPLQVYENKNNRDNADIIDVSGIIKGIDFTLQSDSSSISGSVTFPQSAQSGETAWVDAYSYLTGASSGVQIKFVDTHTVPFIITGLKKASDYILLAWSDKYQEQYFDHQNEKNNAKLVDTTDEIIDDAIQFDLNAGTTISGTVYDNGKPAQGINVIAMSMITDSWGGSTTGPNGTYIIEGLDYADDFQIEARKSGLPPFYYNINASTRDRTLASLVSTLNNNHPTGIDISIYPLESISGMVRDETGKAISNIWINAWSQIQKAGDAVYTAQDGTYAFKALPKSDDYKVSIEAYSSLRFIPESKINVKSGSNNVDFTLRNAYRLFGNVTNNEGKPIVQAQIELYSVSRAFYIWTYTDGSGKYNIQCIPSSNDYMLKISSNTTESYVPFNEMGLQINETVTQTYTIEKNVNLRKGTQISGYVYESDGTTPVANAMIGAYSKDQKFNAIAETDKTGFYLISNIPFASDYNLSAISNLYAKESKTGQVSDSVVNFILKTGGAISGQVTDENGKPLANVRVEIKSDIIHLTTVGLTDSAGYYRVSGLLRMDRNNTIVNDYRIIIYPTGYPVQSQGQKLVGEEVNFICTRGSQNEISGKITDQSGLTPPAGISIIIKVYYMTTTGGYVKKVEAALDGSFKIEGLIPDKLYQLKFIAQGSSLDSSSQWLGDDNTGVPGRNDAKGLYTGNQINFKFDGSFE